jgi:hypothetical protein
MAQEEILILPSPPLPSNFPMTVGKTTLFLVVQAENQVQSLICSFKFTPYPTEKQIL